MIQEQGLSEPRRLENLMLCNTRPCLPNFIDRNYCFRVRVYLLFRERKQGKLMCIEMLNVHDLEIYVPLLFVHYVTYSW